MHICCERGLWVTFLGQELCCCVRPEATSRGSSVVKYGGKNVASNPDYRKLVAVFQLMLLAKC